MNRALWFSVLAAPIAWVFHLVIGYSLEEWFACSPSATDIGRVLGMSVSSVAIVITVLFGLVAIAGAAVGLRCLRTIPEDAPYSARARWMAIVGIMNSVLYLAIIVGGLGPALILQACEVSP